jgi:two-component system phosphate regulon sensor histidine kinase PhoR
MTILASTLLDSLPTAIAVVSESGVISYRNRAFDDCFGEQADAWIRGGARAVGGERGWLQGFFSSADQTVIDVDMDGHVYHIKKLEGETNEEGTHLALSFEDVTTQRSAEQAKSDFTSMIVHDLRGPLSGIQGTLEFVLGDSNNKIDSLHQELLLEATRESERLMGLINELLDFSKIESGNFTVEAEPIRIVGVLRRSVRSLQSVAGRDGIHLLSAHPADLPQIQGSEEKLTQAIINLISNALKFTPKGGVIAVGAQVQRGVEGPDAIVVTITDTGIGIKPDDQKQIFEKYKQSGNKSLRGGGGTGLGLYIVKQIIEGHGGEVELTSLPGVGTCMVLRLPVRRAAA